MISRMAGGALRAPFAIVLGAASETRLLLTARGLRAVGDGFVSLLLPVYLLELGYGPLETGVIATATLADSALLTLLVGLYAHRAAARSLLIGARATTKLGLANLVTNMRRLVWFELRPQPA